MVFGTISSQGWTREDGKSVCVVNGSTATCHFATFVGVLGFVGAGALLVGEWFFEQFSSIKTRKHYVIADMAFSGAWAAFSAICFLVLVVGWTKTDTSRYGYATANVLGAIFFSLCSVFAWVSKNRNKFRIFFR